MRRSPCGQTSDEPHALSVAGLDACEQVEVVMNGSAWLAGFSVDEEEHRRRIEHGLGAVTDRRLLHALWELPEDIPIGETTLRPADVAALGGCESALVDSAEGELRRLFRPAGAVRSATVVARRAEDAIRRLSALPPIYSRLAIARSPSSAGGADLARRRRVGLVTGQAGRWSLEVEPPAPTLGSPAVYRWWVSELAYERWRYAHCAHCTSCAFGSIRSDIFPIGP